ncbi:23 kDa jasmonate-induced protein [Beta vulgaris subsp. vulgaris]|uniref:23 kDa jasmonate-induced protein n=1 Tax=Beta vulgaris subsp. vulgaris TaxID=3555 RepID=UPI002036E15D|nr:23 kDa jasmonate-induced protein [Beta vulgaris subsp. vulgaris]
MANPFGQVVDDDKLEEMPRYIGEIKTQEDRAREAMNLENEYDKNVKAKKYVEGVKLDYGNGASTLCMVYNATGETLYYTTSKDWYGYIGRTPYPFEIGNGQFASFLHVHKTGSSTGSEAAVVFRGKNKSGQPRDFLLAWDTPWSSFKKNKAYSDVGSVGSFNSKWSEVIKNLENSKYTQETKRDGVVIEVATASGTSPVFRATIKTPYSP